MKKKIFIINLILCITAFSSGAMEQRGLGIRNLQAAVIQHTGITVDMAHAMVNDFKYNVILCCSGFICVKLYMEFLGLCSCCYDHDYQNWNDEIEQEMVRRLFDE
jgi:hypothetical protein